MRVDDLDAVCRLFLRVFRDDPRPPNDELLRYASRLFFEAPAYDPAVGGIVYETEEGRLTAALPILPITMKACGRTLTGRMMMAYMTEAGPARRGAWELAWTLKARSQDFVFTDTAVAMSAEMALVGGGVLLPIQSQEWVRVFRPLGATLRIAERRWPALERLPLDALAGLVDRLAARALPDLPPVADGVEDRPASRAEFIALAPSLVEHYAVHPAWTPDELGWILDLAAEKTRHGPLTLRRLADASGATIGAYAYYGGPGRFAHVLNILARPRREEAVINAVMAGLKAAGCAAARGTCQPRQIDYLYRVPGLFFRHNAYTQVLSRHPDVHDAFLKNDVYIGGLAGETWSRLLADRF